MTKLFTLLLFIGLALGQNDSGLDIITLQSGEILKGEIVYSTFTSVTLQKENDGEILEISRKEIDNISTPISRSGATSNSRKNKTSPKTHIYNAGNKLENYVNYTLIGVLLQSGGGYLMSEAIRKETSIKNGATLFLSGSLIQLIGFLQIGDAGNELKKASAKMEEESTPYQK